MKKIVFLSLALLVCALCSAKKPVKKQVQEKTKQERYLDSLKMAVEIRLIQAEMKKEEMEFRAKMEELDRMYRPKEKFLNEVSKILARVDNNIEKEVYIDRIAKEYNVSKEAIYAQTNKLQYSGVNSEKILETMIFIL